MSGQEIAGSRAETVPEAGQKQCQEWHQYTLERLHEENVEETRFLVEKSAT